MEKVKLELVGIDGNAFVILGTFARAARKQGWTQEQIRAVQDEATAGDYDHLLQTIMANVESPDENECEEDDCDE